MDCEHVRTADLVEQYLQGRLSDADRDAFEEHYFACPQCFADLRDAEAIRDELSADRREGITAGSHARGYGRWLAAAAVIILAAGAFWLVPATLRDAPVGPDATATLTGAPVPPPVTPSPERAALIAELSRVEPPPYLPLTLRSAPGASTAAFDEAMTDYGRGDYRAAAAGLAVAAERGPDAPHVQFYAGIAFLMIDEPARAVSAFDRVIASEDAAYASTARFFRAKAYLRRGDLDAAARDLTVVARSNAAQASEAARLLAVLQQRR